MAILKDEFLEIIHRQALSGKAIIRSENPVFRQAGALAMALDLLSERGFTVVLDVQKRRLPVQVEQPSGTALSLSLSLSLFRSPSSLTSTVWCAADRQNCVQREPCVRVSNRVPSSADSSRLIQLSLLPPTAVVALNPQSTL